MDADLVVGGVTVYPFPCHMQTLMPGVRQPGLRIPVVHCDIPADGMIGTYTVSVASVDVDFAGDLIGRPVAWVFPAVKDFGRIQVWSTVVAGFIEHEVHDALYAVARAIERLAYGSTQAEKPGP